MKNPLWRKLMMIAGLSLLLCIPLRMTGGAVGERSMARELVKNNIANNMAGTQRVAGPVLVMPYKQLVTQEVKNNRGDLVLNKHWESRQQVVLPEKLNIAAKVINTPRHRGIYKVQMYQNTMTISARFNLEQYTAPVGEVVIGRPYLALGISDVRGIREMPIGKMNDQPLNFSADTGLRAFESGGVQAPVSLGNAEHFNVTIGVSLNGMERVDFMPLGRDTAVSISSNWPHPSFQGRYLPDSQEITARGFNARWRSTFLASNIEAQFNKCQLNAADCGFFEMNVMGVKLIDPVDVYVQSERALKYGFLFVALSFGVFFLYEILRNLKIHPAQYSLVGAALTLFFLLLVALSEHIAFSLAYIFSAGACISLLWFYVSYVLKSMWRGMGFAGLLSAMFAALYALLKSEDFALLMGAILLFMVLAAVMIITRHFDWFALADSGLDKAPNERD